MIAEKAKSVIDELAEDHGRIVGAYWRLYEAGCIQFSELDEERGEQEHWHNIAMAVVHKARGLK